ncbi:MAG: hypothetical protein ACP5QD_06050, partial [Candidatus Ratteibacteria bacterium]
PGLKMYRYNAGNNMYLGILQEVDDTIAEKQNKGQISLPENFYVYDTREGRFIGYTNTITTDFIPIKPKVYSLLPYRVTSINLSVPGTVKQGTEFSYSAEIVATSTPGFHVFNICLISPSGKEMKYYTKNLAAKNGKIQDKISLALDEQIGLWKIKVKDVSTGTAVEKTFNVK